MKTAFKILPDPSITDLNLLAELGRDGLSLLWYTDSPLTICGLAVYQASRELTNISFAEELGRLLESENLVLNSSITLCYDFKETVIAPSRLSTTADANEIISCMFGSASSRIILSEPIQEIGAVNYYAVPDLLHKIVSDKFIEAKTFHSNSLLIPVLTKQELYCIISNSYIKTFLFIEGRLQIVVVSDYNSPADVAYHLLNICARHKVDPQTVALTLSGLIDKQSGLYEEIYRYFLHIHLEELTGVDLQEDIRAYPQHFFSHLISLVKCVS